MNYFMYLTILSVLTIFLAARSNGQQRFPGKFKMLGTKACSKNLDIYKPNANGQWPAKVVSPKYDILPSFRIKLDITWTANTTNVKGFKIVLKPSGKPDICRILDYTNVIADYPLDMYTFGFLFNNIYPGKRWRAMLYPLPSRDNTSEVITFDTIHVEDAVVHNPMESSFKKSGNIFKIDGVLNKIMNSYAISKGSIQVSRDYDCSNFAPTFTYDYDGKYMEVILSKGPAFCKFEEYKILILYDNKTTAAVNTIPIQDNVDKLRAYFELDVCKGYYSMLVSVNDKFFNDQSKCACKQGAKCIRCPHSEADNLYIVPAQSCTPVMVTDKSVEPDRNGLLFALGVVIGLLFLIALALYVTYWKLSVHLMVRKRGIVLLLDDHEHHTNAVTKVVDYLNEYHLKVYLASTFLKNPDIPDQMVVIGEVLKSDFVLLVLSPALQKRMEAWDKQQDYVEFFKEKNSNILSKAFLELLLQTDKLLVCKFDHAAEFGRCPKPCYSLPTDLTRMVAELSGQSFSQRLILCNCFKSNALRRELQIAIKKTIMFEQSYINWFSKKYVCPTQFFSEEPSQGESIGQSEFINLQKLKDIFTSYEDTSTSISRPEENATAPSIYSIPISERLEQINIMHL